PLRLINGEMPGAYSGAQISTQIGTSNPGLVANCIVRETMDITRNRAKGNASARFGGTPAFCARVFSPSLADHHSTGRPDGARSIPVMHPLRLEVVERSSHGQQDAYRCLPPGGDACCRRSRQPD